MRVFLADDLTVTLDGKMIAANKAEWLAIERARLGKIDRSVLWRTPRGATTCSFSIALMIGRMSIARRAAACIFDPRYHARAVQYQIGPDHLVHSIRIVQSDGFLQDPMSFRSL